MVFVDWLVVLLSVWKEILRVWCDEDGSGRHFYATFLNYTIFKAYARIIPMSSLRSSREIRRYFCSTESMLWFIDVDCTISTTRTIIQYFVIQRCLHVFVLYFDRTISKHVSSRHSFRHITKERFSSVFLVYKQWTSVITQQVVLFTENEWHRTCFFFCSYSEYIRIL